MQLPTKEDTGDNVSPAIPCVVNEEQVVVGKTYMLVMQFGYGDGTVIGPFEAATIPTCITEGYPLIGHFALRTKETDVRAAENIFVPRGGIVRMCGIQYSLHEATAAAVSHLEHVFRLQRGIRSDERARFARDCKYFG